MVKALDDTSNFEEFEVDNGIPCVNDYRKRDGFSGKIWLLSGFPMLDQFRTKRIKGLENLFGLFWLYIEILIF